MPEANGCIMMAEVSVFQSLRQPKLTGQILYRCHENESKDWTFHFYMGQLIYVHGGPHTMRRWLRHVSACCPQLLNLNAEIAVAFQSLDLPTCAIHWQYQVFGHWISRGKVTREQVRQVIVGLVQEVLFDLLQADAEEVRFQASSSLPARLVSLNIENYATKADREWQTWQAAHLRQISPNLAPVIRQPEALQQAAGNVYRVLSKLLDGQRTLRDLSLGMKRDLLSVTRSLMPYVELQYLELQAVADIAEPSQGRMRRPPGEANLTPNPTQPSLQQPLIACIDDSPIICQGMERIVTRANYRFVGISDPLRAIAQLLAQKPDLVFLDLVMPNANGYEICGQLRKLTLFKDTPIVILTGQDGILDRVRAKFVGATDFITKPVTAITVLETITRHLVTTPSPPDSSS